MAGSLVPAKFNRTSCGQVHELSQSHCRGNLEGTFFMITFILHSSCFCEIWEVFVSWTTYDYLYYAPNLAC